MSNQSFAVLMQHCQDRSNQSLANWLTQPSCEDSRLLEAMRHGALLGGKRIRPFLVYTIGQMLSVSEDDLDTPAAAIEFIHAYSLIHDDLPAMDDDELRRGQPTCHIVFDEAIAILAGDALQTLAFEVLASGQLSKEAESQRIAMIQALARASGAAGMCVGQAYDLEAENQQVSLQHLQKIHQHKTGALISCAITLGALAAGQRGVAILEPLNQFSSAIGLAFQVQDDILDITSDTSTLGKPSGSDLELHKSTYPSLLGLEGAKEKAQLLLQDALEALKAIPYDTTQLEAFARYIIERNN
ncbi:(2E,6E)-farnesyl diphosphate synthase [Vibrio sp. SS-MA-C1-2]|uniref:(2E,6E)-farnesyl diphosphate synthase n=1 Tax=Vibrio sp. SS-MA-C1-2 TaxID=2908646 RepID=UPI001F3CE6E6|nr:(2E,6E)-farnesyl diphosphate synthase [Vibrio sp. SS-MA-C1-2]UJF20186.1 (2E,6E)-farnesyl diphosphate synthase [Vibrio sp. SS-MA-C1-2]